MGQRPVRLNVAVDEPAVVCRAVAHAELDEAGEGDGVRAEPRRGELGEQRERGWERPLDAEAGERSEGRVRALLRLRLRLRVDAAAAPASGGNALAREAFEQGVHHMYCSRTREGGA